MIMVRIWKAKKFVELSLAYALILTLFTYLTQDIFTYFNVASGTILFNAVRFLTAPFNAYFEQNYVSNIVVVFGILLVVELYFKLTKRAEIIEIIFISGIGSSYILSLDWVV